MRVPRGLAASTPHHSVARGAPMGTECQKGGMLAVKMSTSAAAKGSVQTGIRVPIRRAHSRAGVPLRGWRLMARASNRLLTQSTVQNLTKTQRTNYSLDPRNVLYRQN